MCNALMLSCSVFMPSMPIFVYFDVHVHAQVCCGPYPCPDLLSRIHVVFKRAVEYHLCLRCLVLECTG